MTPKTGCTRLRRPRPSFSSAIIALFNRKYPVGSSPVFDLPDGKTVQIKVLKAPRRDGSRVLFFGSDYATGHEADHEIAINSNRWIKLLT
jgi:hypothetical protein